MRAENYEMIAIFMVSSVVSKYARKPAENFDESDAKNIFLHWDGMTWEQVRL